MKLPENRKERLQVFALIGIGVLLAISTITQLVVFPFLASRKKRNAALVEQTQKLEKARKELLQAPSVKEDYDKVSAELDRIVAASVLRSILGSYLVGVSETIENAARSAGLTTEEIQEVGIRDLPVKKGSSHPPAFKSYAVQTTAEGSYAQVLAFLNAIETRNPFLCVTEIRISGRQDKPEQHRITFRIEWPIHASPDTTSEAPAEKKGGSP